MHEVSIAMGMIDELFRIAKENNARKIINVSLRIGKMSGIVTDSLKFAFDAIKLEHPLLSSAGIQIKEIPLIYECKNCRNKFEAETGYFPSCPDCKSFSLKLLSGEEMDIENLEIEV